MTKATEGETRICGECRLHQNIDGVCRNHESDHYGHMMKEWHVACEQIEG